MQQGAPFKHHYFPDKLKENKKQWTSKHVILQRKLFFKETAELFVNIWFIPRDYSDAFQLKKSLIGTS